MCETQAEAERGLGNASGSLTKDETKYLGLIVDTNDRYSASANAIKNSGNPVGGKQMTRFGDLENKINDAERNFCYIMPDSKRCHLRDYITKNGY